MPLGKDKEDTTEPSKSLSAAPFPAAQEALCAAGAGSSPPAAEYRNLRVSGSGCGALRLREKDRRDDGLGSRRWAVTPNLAHITEEPRAVVLKRFQKVEPMIVSCAAAIPATRRTTSHGNNSSKRACGNCFLLLQCAYAR